MILVVHVNEKWHNFTLFREGEEFGQIVSYPELCDQLALAARIPSPQSSKLTQEELEEFWAGPEWKITEVTK